nr:MAG TPA: NinF protein [Caudoviricetes sp.]
MLSPHEAQSYEQQSIARAMTCANCGKKLHVLEVHVCEVCCAELMCVPNSSMYEEEDDD